VPADVEVAGVSVVGSTAHVATSLGQLRIPYVLDPQQQAGTAALLGSGEGLGVDMVLAEFVPRYS
ncbi:MAG: hypothetical protein SW019_23460, partial [Actinomycetota bacterium]|nr:hypothetical protein [Actinomycetota bacterium]